MLNKDIYHSIMLFANITDISSMYIAFRPLYDIKYYISRHIKRGNAIWNGAKVTYYYVPIGAYYYMSNNYMHIPGRLHRYDDLPAFTIDGVLDEWYRYGKLHRDNDKPAIINISRNELCWYRHGRLHRDNDQPASIRDQYAEWYQDGERHRGNGQPAVIYNNGLREWWYRNIMYHVGV